jgi:hypothetical protein
MADKATLQHLFGQQLLSFPFSSSKARNRFASDGSMPPYFDLYL